MEDILNKIATRHPKLGVDPLACPERLIGRAKKNALHNLPCSIAATLTSSTVHHSSHQLTGAFYRITMSLKRPFVPKSDVKQWFTTTTTSHPKSLWAWYLMNHWFDRIQILYRSSLGISNDLINFWGESIKNKIADEGHFEKIDT